MSFLKDLISKVEDHCPTSTASLKQMTVGGIWAFLTNKPAIVTLLHHVHDVSFSELQFVFVARQVIVQGPEPAVTDGGRLDLLFIHSADTVIQSDLQ